MAIEKGRPRSTPSQTERTTGGGAAAPNGGPQSVHQVSLTRPGLAEDSTKRGRIQERGQKIRIQKGYIKSQDSAAKEKLTHLALSISGYSLLVL